MFQWRFNTYKDSQNYETRYWRISKFSILYSNLYAALGLMHDLSGPENEFLTIEFIESSFSFVGNNSDYAFLLIICS